MLVENLMIKIMIFINGAVNMKCTKIIRKK